MSQLEFYTGLLAPMRLRSKLPKGRCRIPVVTFTLSHLLTDTNNTVLQNNSSVKLCSNSQNSDFISYMGGSFRRKARGPRCTVLGSPLADMSGSGGGERMGLFKVNTPIRKIRLVGWFL